MFELHVNYFFLTHVVHYVTLRTTLRLCNPAGRNTHTHTLQVGGSPSFVHSFARLLVGLLAREKAIRQNANCFGHGVHFNGQFYGLLTGCVA